MFKSSLFAWMTSDWSLQYYSANTAGQWHRKTASLLLVSSLFSSLRQGKPLIVVLTFPLVLIWMVSSQRQRLSYHSHCRVSELQPPRSLRLTPAGSQQTFRQNSAGPAIVHLSAVSLYLSVGIQILQKCRNVAIKNHKRRFLQSCESIGLSSSFPEHDTWVLSVMSIGMNC